MGLEGDKLPPKELFPLELVAVFVEQEKMTSDTAESLWFWTHLKLAQQAFYVNENSLSSGSREVAWMQVCNALHDVLHLCEIWAAKQVWDTAKINYMH